MIPMNETEYEKSISELEATGKFRVLRRAELGPVDPTSLGNDRVVIIVDTETTGLDAQRDEIIEIGMIACSYSNAGELGTVLGTFTAMQQPRRPIPSLITRLTGISDSEVKGQRIDQSALEAFLRPASLIVAHNAAFDRPMCEKLSDIFAQKPWACSATEIDWQSFGFEGTKLVYILNQFGKYHSGHRAFDDCVALSNILRLNIGTTGASVFAELLSCARKTRCRISVASPYELRSALKERGYRWHPGSPGRPRSWWIEIEEQNESDEINFLKHQANLPSSSIIVETVTALNRFKLATSPIAKTNLV
jgi:DNA polymerase III subunit epsilon